MDYPLIFPHAEEGYHPWIPLTDIHGPIMLIYILAGVIFTIYLISSHSVNDKIIGVYGSLVYQTLDDAICLIQNNGRHCILRKHDLRDAFRMNPIGPLDYWLFLFEWENRIYVDIFLPFGLRTAPFIFNLFGEDLHWILEWVFSVVHYLDDFLLIQDPDPELFGILATNLGLSKKFVKRRDGYVVDFTGIELDTHLMEAISSKDKHDRALLGVKRLLRTDIVAHRTLEKLLEFLLFAKVNPLGPLFSAISLIYSIDYLIFIHVPFVAYPRRPDVTCYGG